MSSPEPKGGLQNGVYLLAKRWTVPLKKYRQIIPNDILHEIIGRNQGVRCADDTSDNRPFLGTVSYEHAIDLS